MSTYNDQQLQNNATNTSAQDEIPLHVPLSQPGAQVFVNPGINATATTIPTFVDTSGETDRAGMAEMIVERFMDHRERITALEGQLLQMQAQYAENVRTFVEEQKLQRESIQILTQRIDKLEQAPKERQEQFQKLWNWVKGLDERLGRLEPGKAVRLTPWRGSIAAKGGNPDAEPA